MQEIIQVLIVAGILSFFLYKERDRNDKQVERLMKELEAYRKALLARNLAEYSASEYMTKPDEFVEPSEEFIETTDLDDTEFGAMIKKQAESEEELIEL